PRNHLARQVERFYPLSRTVLVFPQSPAHSGARIFMSREAATPGGLLGPCESCAVMGCSARVISGRGVYRGTEELPRAEFRVRRTDTSWRFSDASQKRLSEERFCEASLNWRLARRPLAGELRLGRKRQHGSAGNLIVR